MNITVHKLLIKHSIPINLLVHYLLVVIENLSLGEQDPENKNDNFGCSSLGDKLDDEI